MDSIKGARTGNLGSKYGIRLMTQFHEISFWVTVMTQVCETSLPQNVPYAKRFSDSTNRLHPLVCVTGTCSEVSVNYSNKFVPK